MHYAETQSFDKAKSSVEDHVEIVDRRQSVAEEVTELSGIEATAASKAAWLISITVSIGGFLFGRLRLRTTEDP
jgi:MFS transporter, SP family, solute carrier family 2 (myo-inositol transporter), member 13